MGIREQITEVSIWTEKRGINGGWVKMHVDDFHTSFLALNVSLALVYVLYLYFI